MSVLEMKEPLGFGVRESEPPTDASYKALKKSLLDDPSIVSYLVELYFPWCQLRNGIVIFTEIGPDELEDVHNPPPGAKGPFTISGNHRYQLTLTI